jgi:DNA polymerase IV (DinB-like DNA polymerase)
MDPHRVIISIDLDYFYAQCEEVRRPELKTRPLVVCVFSGRNETSGAVSTANYVARKLGVKSGIPIITAKKILAKDKDAEFLPADHEYYEKVSNRVMQLIRSKSPAFEQVSIDEAFIDVSKDANDNFEYGASIAKKIKEEILEKEKLTCSVGIGPNKLIAKMAADSAKPNGLMMVKPEEVKEFLGPKQVRKLVGVGPKIEQRLESLGIRTIGELADYDVKLLSNSFGENLGPRLKQLATGTDIDPVREKPAEQLSRIITLKSDAESLSFEQELAPLADDLSNKLKSSGMKCQLISIIAITSELKTKTKARKLDHATNSSSEILSGSLDLFRSYFNTTRGENMKLRRIGIRVSSLGKENLMEGNQSEDQATLTSFLPV